MKANYFSKKLTIALITGSIFFTACSSEAGGNEDVLSENAMAVTFSIGGINDETDPDPDTSSPSASINRTVTGPTTKSINLGEDITAVTSVETSTIGASQNTNNATVASNRMNTYASTSPMKQGYTYRVLVYDSKKNYVATINQAASPNTPTIKVDLVKGATYTWYAYSYNDNTVLPPVNTADPQVAAENKDLLYATGSFQAILETNHQKITFNHVMAKLTVIVDANSVPAAVNNVNNITFNTNLQKGTYSLKNPGFGSTGTTTAPYTYTLKEVTTGNSTVKMAEFYTLPSAQSSSFNVNTGTMDIHDFNPGTSNLTPNAAYQFVFPQNVTPTAGINTNLKINIQRGADVGGNYWAAGNLWYDAAAPEGYKYKIRPNADNRSTSGFYDTDFWAYGALTPPGEPNNSTDLCLLVYPQNTWRVPNLNDFNALKDATSLTQSNNGFYGTIATSKADTKKSVKFGWDGYMSPVTLVHQNKNYWGMYWQANWNSSFHYSTRTQDQSIQPNQSSYSRYFRMNIRCIRAK